MAPRSPEASTVRAHRWYSSTRTPLRWFTDAVHHVAQHVPHAEVREVAGAGHACPVLAPEAVADEIVRFLASSRAAGALHAAAASA